MPRTQKCRKVCRLPEILKFNPVGKKGGKCITLAVDEYETIRLIDKEGFSQEECGVYMKVARTTVQQIYTSARKKIANAIVEGRPLKIEGGCYILCDGNEEFCACGGCMKHRKCKGENL